MQDWIADYHVVRPLDDPARPGSRFVALAPPRLDLDGRPVVIEVGPGEPADLLPDLSRWAAAAARAAAGDPGRSALAVPLEVGPLDAAAGGPGPGGTDAQMWLSRLADVEDRPGADPVVIVAGAARGLATLHEAGGVHGAISAGRMLTTPDGGVLDLPPLTGPATPGLVARVSEPGQLDGLAPEVARGEPPSAASDVWALGACLHTAVTGRRVHPDLDRAVLLNALQRVVFEPARIDAGDLTEILSACCQADPSQRPSAAAVAAGLAGLR
ncbi:protein kinase [Acidiferrimicrobium sp. IK]|uniref:protein kinase n=1 Tax=Acidiferrimicrobium sp. IK TaxID=2871700 RepID=UPI0021CAE33C|nr:protein kinase [Acidiferrimicrobium sp. IK]MCU4185668.1 protein kinase [Acidiferrimicrobium sp. IK]